MQNQDTQVVDLLRDVESERNFVACILRDPERVSFEATAAGLIDAAFTDESARVVFLVAGEIRARGGVPDRYAVASLLADQQKPEHLSKINPDAISANSGWYMANIIRVWRLRQIRKACESTQTAIEDGEAPEALVAKLQSAIIGVAHSGGQLVKTLATTKAAKIAQWRSAKERGFVGVPSWSRKINREIGGYRPGVMTVLGGYRGEGKSTWARNEAKFAAKECGIPVGILTPEDPADVASASIVGNEHNFSCYYCDTGEINRDLGDIERCWTEMENLPIYMIDAPQTIADVELNLTMLKARYNIGMAIIDHLQYIQSARRFESRNHEIAHYTSRIAALARRLDIPILVLSQLSRDAERHDRKPRLSDLRDSGAIEQDARLALLLYRDNDDNCHYMEVAKNNLGPSGGKIKLTRKDGFQRFEEYDDHAKELREMSGSDD